jgi:hypothetical protein
MSPHGDVSLAAAAALELTGCLVLALFFAYRCGGFGSQALSRADLGATCLLLALLSAHRARKSATLWGGMRLVREA